MFMQCEIGRLMRLRFWSGEVWRFSNHETNIGLELAIVCPPGHAFEAPEIILVTLYLTIPRSIIP